MKPAKNKIADLMAQLRLRQGMVAPQLPPLWDVPSLSGHLIEISAHGGSSALTLACGLVAQAQRASEPTAWITSPTNSFFPVDAQASGIDLHALVTVRVQERVMARVADHLVRSGAFGLIVVDLGLTHDIPMPMQSRLAAAAQTHETALIFLTNKHSHASSLGSLIAVRGQAQHRAHTDGEFLCDIEIIKDKRRGPGWHHTEACYGPPGLC